MQGSSLSSRSACRSFQRTLATTGSTGRRCPICSRSRSPASRRVATAFWLISISTDSGPRVYDYFDADLSHEEITRRYPGVMKKTARFDARKVRAALLARGGPDESGFVRFAYRPFDTRWLYWEKDTKLLDEKRADYRPHVFRGECLDRLQQAGDSSRLHAWHLCSGSCELEVRILGCPSFPCLASGGWFREQGCRGLAPPESLWKGTALSRSVGSWRRRPVPPRSRHAARS